MYIGRFAPSPTGPLHFGSLVAALASWLDARAANGRWLVRIEDLDRPRVVPGAAEEILNTLRGLGLYWDGEPVFQSRRLVAYADALSKIRDKTYGCSCSRSEIADSSLGLAADGARIYPGTCRSGMKPGSARRALRFRVPAEAIRFDDRVQGPQAQDLEREVGDFVLQRADGLFTYQLAVVVDDAEQGITDVVRGADLLESTARQIALQRALARPQPRYLHVPAAIDASGEKLSKQTGAPAADASMLGRALAFLGQPPAESLEDAVRAWDPARIPRARAIIAP
jgi:glutamyl-Q tRNA(Asp) synthetase